MGREPRRFGLLDRQRMNRDATRRPGSARHPHRCQATAQHISTSRCSRWSPSRGRSRPMRGSSSWTSRPRRSTNARSRPCSTSSAVSRRAASRVIYICHRLDELYAVCDRVTIMRDGKTIDERPMAGASASSSSWRDARQGNRRGAPLRGDRLLERKADIAAGDRCSRPMTVERPIRCCTTPRSRCAAARSSVWPGCSVPAGPRWRAPLFGADQPVRASSRSRQTCPLGSRRAMPSGPGSALLRGPQGGRHHSRTCRCGKISRWRRCRALARNGIVDRAEQRQIVDRFIDLLWRSRQPVPSRRSASFPAAISKKCCWRAGSASTRAALARRADARHRCRRQSRDPGADRIAGRRGHVGVDDITRMCT